MSCPSKVAEKVVVQGNEYLLNLIKIEILSEPIPPTIKRCYKENGKRQLVEKRFKILTNNEQKTVNKIDEYLYKFIELYKDYNPKFKQKVQHNNIKGFIDILTDIYIIDVKCYKSLINEHVKIKWFTQLIQYYILLNKSQRDRINKLIIYDIYNMKYYYIDINSNILKTITEKCIFDNENTINNMMNCII